MAAGWLQPGVGNIAEGWGHPPELRAAPIGDLVSSIMRDRLLREKMSQENIADAIKNVRQQREEQAYLEAMQKAGILPEGDYGGLGVKGASILAQEIQRKRLADSLIARREQIGTGGGRGRGGRGGSGENAQVVPEGYYGLSVAPGRHAAGPEIVEKDGIKYLVVRTSKSVTYKRLPGQVLGGGEKQIQPTRAERANAAPTIPGLTVYPDNTAVPLPPDIAPEQEPLPGGADKAENLAPGYGVPPSGLPQPGEIRKGFRFKGGDPADQNNWEPV